jgi:hypothetical protein
VWASSDLRVSHEKAPASAQLFGNSRSLDSDRTNAWATADQRLSEAKKSVANL